MAVNLGLDLDLRLNILMTTGAYLSSGIVSSQERAKRFRTEVCQYNHFHISGRPPSLICDDVTTQQTVMNFHGPSKIVLHFHVDWFGSFCTSLTYERLTTDRQTDRLTDRHRHRLKPPFSQRKTRLNKYTYGIFESV